MARLRVDARLQNIEQSSELTGMTITDVDTGQECIQTENGALHEIK